MVAFIDAHREVHGVESIGTLLPIAPSTYFRRKAEQQDPTKRSARAQRDDVLQEAVSLLLHGALNASPSRAIQELAGHGDLGTTQRYMHLSPAALHAAIELLDTASIGGFRGDIVETATGTAETVKI